MFCHFPLKDELTALLPGSSLGGLFGPLKGLIGGLGPFEKVFKGGLRGLEVFGS